MKKDRKVEEITWRNRGWKSVRERSEGVRWKSKSTDTPMRNEERETINEEKVKKDGKV